MYVSLPLRIRQRLHARATKKGSSGNETCQAIKKERFSKFWFGQTERQLEEAQRKLKCNEK